MDKLINELTHKTGIDRSQAEKVVSYLKDNVSRIPEMLRGDNHRGGQDRSQFDNRR